MAKRRLAAHQMARTKGKLKITQADGSVTIVSNKQATNDARKVVRSSTPPGNRRDH